MNGVLGGFKNMLRQWRINLNKKKKIHQQKEKYFKWKTLFYSTLAIIIAPFGYLFSKEKEKKSYHISEQIKIINQKLDEIIINRQPLDKNINNEILNIEKRINKIQSKKEQQIIKKDLKVIELKKQYIVNKKKLSQGQIDLVIRKVNENPHLNKKIEIKDSKIKVVSKHELKEENEKMNPKIYKYQVKNSSHKVNVFYPFVANANKELKKENEKIKLIENKIAITKQYNHFYELEYELKLLRKKIELLKEEYDNLKKQYSIDLSLDFDKYDLARNNDKIIELLDRIDNDLKIIENKKQIIFRQKKSNKEAKQEKNNELPKQKVEKINRIDERVVAQSFILKDLNRQTDYLENYFKKLDKSINKKKTLVSSLIDFSKNVLKFAISLFPIKIFKNKLLGTLVSGIMINNSIKTMRKMTNPQLQINYEYFINQYNNSKDLLNNISRVYNNSLEELYSLKEELLYLGLLEQNPELKKQIEEIEGNILSKLEQLQLKNKSLDKVYVKIKKNVA